jgi:aspartate/methionine/tyrosine aminotransferase
VGLGADVLEEIAALAARVGATVLVDEVLLDFAFDPGGGFPWRPACKVAENTVSWSSLSVGLGVPTLRAGWIVSNRQETSRAIRAAGDYVCPLLPAASTFLGIRVLERAVPTAERAGRVLAAGRRVMDRWMASERRLDWVPPSMGPAGLIRLPGLVQDTVFSEHLRERYETRVVPGSLFEAPGFIRVSYGGLPAIVDQGLANFSSALDDLVGTSAP